MGHVDGREGYHWSRDAWQPSAAQRRVLDGLAAGHTNAVMAAQLGLTPETVKWHVSQLLAETGCQDRRALARWWRARQRHAPALTLPPALMARPALGGLAMAAIELALAVLLAAAARSGGASPATPTAASPPSTSVARQAATVATAMRGLQDIGPFIVSGSGVVEAENRATASVVHLAEGDLVQFPPGVRWESLPGVDMSPPSFLAPSATVAGQKLYLTVFTDGGSARFERLDDRTFRVAVAGSVIIWAEDAGRADHPVAVDAAGHLLLDPAPVAGDVVAVYASGEALAVRSMAVVGRLAPVRRTQYPTEWFFNMCEAERCDLSYRVGPLKAPFAGTVVCQHGPEFDLDGGTFRLRFRDAGTLRDNRIWPGPPAADCGRGRTVQAEEVITESFLHYIVTAVSAGGEPLSVVVAQDGTLYVGTLAATASCPPCRGN